MWLSFIDNPKVLRDLYDRPPELRLVNVTSFGVRPNGMLHMGIELNEYPKNPPKEWKNSNAVNISLAFMGTKNLQIKGWDLDNYFTFEFKNGHDSIEVKAKDEQNCTKVSFKCLSIFISNISAYISGSRTNPACDPDEMNSVL